MAWERQDVQGSTKGWGPGGKQSLKRRDGLGQGALGHHSCAPEMGRRGTPRSQAPEQLPPNCFIY